MKMKQQQAAVLVQKKLLSSAQKKALVSYVLKKRRKEQDVSTDDTKLPADNPDDEEGVVSSDKSKASYNAGEQISGRGSGPNRDPEESLEDVTEQLKTLRDKLESLKKEKHLLFQELKKVLHEEDEKKQQQQMEHQKLLMAEQERAAVYEGGGGAGGVAYRGDPRLDKIGMKHPSGGWSTGYGETPPPNKVPRGGLDVPHPQGAGLYGAHSYLQQRMPVMPHVAGTHSFGPTYPHQFRGGAHYGGFSPILNTSSQYGVPYQGGMSTPGGFIGSPGPLPPPPPHQQQYMSPGLPPHEYTASQQSHFPFEPRPQSRYPAPLRQQRPTLSMGHHYSATQPAAGTTSDSSPSHITAFPNERMKYQQRNK